MALTKMMKIATRKVITTVHRQQARAAKILTWRLQGPEDLIITGRTGFKTMTIVIDNDYQDFSLSPTKFMGRIDQDFVAQNNPESQDRLDISYYGRGTQIIWERRFNTFLKTFPGRISSLPCLHITATGMCFGGNNHTCFNIRINDGYTAWKKYDKKVRGTLHHMIIVA